ncbi:urate hydroxylase PuuD [Oryzomicrobium sp.]|uniref:urate hydroxylase PuuD n=1 Tax=Oryzomicrobium sp. TaxID=1911578 RepID=UPI0025FB02AF|nr:urate hydroxylase PuuD [Oryzomicrobium sp.]MCE1244550.1 urate hydroxylase PuuD [Oryzomicrobium sp.]
MEAYLLDWANLLLRWLHLIAGIAWIGASFYFVMLDNSLRPPKKPEDAKRGVFGELWAVHGGGFYCSQKFLTGPKGEPLTDDLHWSKWEAYTTWMSGMGLMAVIYWVGASSYLIDPKVMALAPATAVGISIAFLVGGWVVYDLLCRLLVGRDNLLGALVFAFVVLCDWLLHQVFSARGAYIHVGAMMATMMVANVFFHIIPGQKRMVEQIRAGQEVDTRPGLIGKQRSVHNTYFTLPVLFIMISNHYPMTYANANGWLILVVMMLAGVLIRQFFVLRHRGQVKWWLPASGVALIAVLAALMAPRPVDAGGAPVAFNAVHEVVEQRCIACHSAHPSQPGFAQPPKGVTFDTSAQIGQHAAKMAETVASGYMPLGNLTHITDDERKLIATWYAQGAKLAN